MSISSNLLRRGYKLIDEGQLHNAEMVIDAVVREDPKNVTAWKAYLKIYQYNNNLPWLVERIEHTCELTEQAKQELRAYLEFLKQCMDCPTVPVEAVTSAPRPAAPRDTEVVFEMIDQFEIPTRPAAERSPRKKERQLFKYTIPAYVWQALGLLVVFYFSVRTLVFGSALGYFLLAVFIFGGIFWFRNLADHKSGLPVVINRAYAMETKHELTTIEKKTQETQKGESKNPRIRYLDE